VKVCPKSFLGGVFIAIGGLFDLIVAGGAVSLRENNPSLATLIAAFTFPIGFVLVILTNVELVTSNVFIMMYMMPMTWYKRWRVSPICQSVEGPWLI
jgi:formate/nitrite transporter FocA (FNT family)